ncbi:SDR family NAD(P)-dependent oxidoreductase [Limnoglobus roseus]|uniref:KR domain-containing protein n=1 Tax=Limnoglobus roseus TaxID=2598579 RepID=A0A5C1AN17_9BACT|nr:SDR family NAD(P)-dependent oxidoreductase [Limnoglobus roseus]QEL20809.1 KR domain-containing protein [Limnoglobus roseus]
MAGAFFGRVVVVTGASSGIGRELARQLAAAGARVGLVARREDALRELAELIRAAGGEAVVAPADVADRAQATAAVAVVRDAFGPVDLMIANAGVGAPTRLDPVNVPDVEAMIRVNVLGVVYAFAAVMPDMLARRSGHLAAVSSLASYLALPGESGYCASKAAVNTYLAGLQAHLRGRGVTVTTLCPGFVKTAMTEGNDFWMPGLLTAEEAARRMLRALSRRKAVYNFPLSCRLLVGLARWLPAWAVGRVMADYNDTAAGH